jgi:hypothetical protein
VVTFVGQLQSANSAPTFTSIPTQTINAGVHLAITNFASDSDLPQQLLTFNLLNGPGNSTLTPLNATNAVFSWRPFVSQAGTTNLISVSVTDNGVPPLSATNTFNVTVNPVSRPAFDSINVSAGQLNLIVDGMIGPDYTIWVSTNLFNWQVQFTTNSPVTPFTVTDSNLTDAERFYRIQIGP